MYLHCSLLYKKNKYQFHFEVVISSQNVFTIHLASLDIPDDTYENGISRQ
jgi:hypothetical protein